MNKKWNKIIENFNTPDTALVISAWPVEGKNAVNHGIAWYTKMTVTEMAKKQKKKFVILAETNHDNKPQLLQNGRVLVLRVFDNTHKSLYPKILQWLKPFTKINKVYVHSEFGTNGGIFHFAMILPFLALIRGMGKRIIFYSHNVISDVSMLAGHLNIARWQAGVINIGIQIYYKLLSILTEKIVVLDPSLGQRLARFVPESKILALNMPVEKKILVDKMLALKKLGITTKKKIIVAFGFVSFYKGTDWLVKNVPDNAELYVAGGQSYSLANKPYYQKYYLELTEIAASKNNVMMTGFVPEEKIGLYMSAADLVVLPYRGLMGSSGSLSHTLSYEKPFMLSVHMKGLLHNTGTVKKQITFETNKAGMKKIETTLNNNNQLKLLASYSKILSNKRRLADLSILEYNELYEENLAK